MATYRKKPRQVEAVQLLRARTMSDQLFSEEPAWLKTALVNHEIVTYIPDTHEGFRARINTLEGTMVAQPDDYIIRGVQGELYPCKPDIFEATYDLDEAYQPPTIVRPLDFDPDEVDLTPGHVQRMTDAEQPELIEQSTGSKVQSSE